MLVMGTGKGGTTQSSASFFSVLSSELSRFPLAEQLHVAGDPADFGMKRKCEQISRSIRLRFESGKVILCVGRHGEVIMIQITIKQVLQGGCNLFEAF